MAKDKTDSTDSTPQPSTPPMSDFQALTAAFTAAVAANAPEKRIRFGKHDVSSHLNPTGKRSRTLSRVMYQNGRPLNTRVLHDKEIALLEKLTPGRYIGNRVTILEHDEGLDKALHIVYQNKTVDQRQDLQSEVPNFFAMLSAIVNEAEERKVAAKAAHKAAVKDALDS